MTVTIDVDVGDLAGHPGASREVRVTGPIEDLDTEVARLPQDRPVRAELLLEGVVEGVLATGTLEGVIEETCSRCLKPFERSFSIEVHELFAPGGGPTEDEYRLPPEGVIDVEPMVRDAVGVEMPFAPLCRPDCLGLCERCGGDRNLGECTCPAESADSRWSALAAIDFPEEREG